MEMHIEIQGDITYKSELITYVTLWRCVSYVLIKRRKE